MDKQGAAKFKGGGSIRPWEDNEETRSIDVSAKLLIESFSWLIKEVSKGNELACN